MSDPRPGGEYVYEALVDAGIEHLIGLPGTQTLPLDRVVEEREEMTYVMARHETAVPHVAWGYYEASGRPAATLTVPGPGDANAIHGLKNALEDCVPIVHVSADVNPEDRGKGPIHEIDPATYDHAVKANLTVERRGALPAAVARAVETALTAPYGPVRIGVPSGVLADAFEAAPASASPERVEHEVAGAVDRAADLLAAADRPLLFVGGGARRSPGGPRAVSALADALRAPVVATFKGKGVFPEDDPRFLGVSGSALPAGARRALGRADAVLALGTDFDGPATDGWSLPMGDRTVHVNLDPAEFGAAYAPDVAVPADVAAAGDALLERLDPADPGGWDGARVGRVVREEYRDRVADLGLLEGTVPAHTPALLEAVREATPRSATVTLDVGGFRIWALEVFAAYAPERFVCAGSWAGMGVGLPAAVGAALGADRPVLSLTGDGGLMMCSQELHTAVEHDLDLVVVVSNNADYGIISKSAGEGSFAWEAPSFEAIASGYGCRALTVESPAGAADATREAFERGGPTLIDARVATEEPSAVEAADYESTVDL